MCKKCLCFLKNLDEERTMTKKEFLQIILVGVLAGIVFGLLTSPRKTMIFGSFNGNKAEDIYEDDDCC